MVASPPPLPPPAHEPARRQSGSESLSIFQRIRNRRLATNVRACAHGYAHKIVAVWPALLIFFSTLLIGGIIGLSLGLQPPEVETDLDHFMKSDLNSSLYYDAFLAAKEYQIQQRSIQSQTSVYEAYDLLFVYELKNSAHHSNIFEFGSMFMIQRLEQSIRGLSRFKALCASTQATNQGLCNPGISFVNYMMPTQDLATPGSIEPTALTLDGNGIDTVPVSGSLRLADLHILTSAMLPRSYDSTLSDSWRGVRSLRSIFRFKFHLGESTDAESVRDSKRDQVVKDWKEFLRDVLSFLEDGRYLEEDNVSPLNVYVSGDFVEDVEVIDALKSDMFFAIGSYILVTLHLVNYTRSVVLSVGGIMIIVLATFLSYACFAIVGTKTLSISCFLSVFFLLGVGCDVLMAYADFWHDSGRVSGVVGERVIWTYQMGAKTSLLTTVVMAVAFFSCLLSVLRPLRDLGTCLGIAVLFVWAIASLLFVPLCVLNDRLKFGDALFGIVRIRWIKVFEFYTKKMKVVRWSCTAISVIALVIFMVGSLVAIETDMALPSIYPEKHHQNRGFTTMSNDFRSLYDVFDDNVNAPPQSVQICKVTEFHPLRNGICAFYWCDVRVSVPTFPQSGNSSCKCWRNTFTTCNAGDVATAQQRFVSFSALTSAQLTHPVAHQMSTSAQAVNFLSLNSSSLVSSVNVSSGTLKPLMQLEWESGDGAMTSWTEAQASFSVGPLSPSCGWNEICFCGSRICELPSIWKEVYAMSMPLSQRRLVSPDDATRKLQGQQWSVPEPRRAVVIVVLGLAVEDKSALVGRRDAKDVWRFQNDFAASHLQAQRDMKKLCVQLPSELRVTAKKCWIEHFETWLLAQNHKFPAITSQFPGFLNQFANLHPQTGSPFLWIQGGSLKAVYFEFTVDVDTSEQPSKVLDYMRLWDNYLDNWNLQIASPFVRGAWHTSKLWWRGEAHDKMMTSMGETLGLEVSCVFLVVLLATKDVILATYSLLGATWVMWSLLFCLTAVAGWDFGLIEVMVVTIFTSYAFSGVTHVIHMYCETTIKAHERYERVRNSLCAVGRVVLGSCAAMALSALFLLFCQLRFFSKMGVALLLVAGLSAFTALAPLTAVLLLAGSLQPGRILGFHCIRACIIARRSSAAQPAEERPYPERPSQEQVAVAPVPRPPDAQEAFSARNNWPQSPMSAGMSQYGSSGTSATS